MNHQTKRIKHGDLSADVDTLIAPLILRLWQSGIRTCQSCEENEPGVVWIQFPDYEEGKKFLDRCAMHLSCFQWDKNFIHMELSDIDGEGCFSIRFSQDEIKLVKRLFPAKIKPD